PSAKIRNPARPRAVITAPSMWYSGIRQIRPSGKKCTPTTAATHATDTAARCSTLLITYRPPNNATASMATTIQYRRSARPDAGACLAAGAVPTTNTSPATSNAATTSPATRTPSRHGPDSSALLASTNTVPKVIATV